MYTNIDSNSVADSRKVLLALIVLAASLDVGWIAITAHVTAKLWASCRRWRTSQPRSIVVLPSSLDGADISLALP